MAKIKNITDVIREINNELVFDDDKNFVCMIESFYEIKDDYKVKTLLYILDGWLEELYGTEKSNMATKKIIEAINELEKE